MGGHIVCLSCAARGYQVPLPGLAQLMCEHAGVVELVDTGDLKSPGLKKLYGFKSRLRYNVSLSVQRYEAIPRIAGRNPAGLEPSERRPEGGTAARDGGGSE